MPTSLLLKITAELENLTNLQPSNGFDHPDVMHFLKLKCEGCGHTRDKEVGVCFGETMYYGNKLMHLVSKCDECERDAFIQLISGYGSPLTLEQESTTIMMLMCEGLIPIEYSSSDPWVVETLKGKKVVADFSEGVSEVKDDDNDEEEEEEEKVVIRAVRNLQVNFVRA